MKEIYIVYGMAGEYEDYHCWDICAWESEAMAREHVKLASNALTIWKSLSFLEKEKMPKNQIGYDVAPIEAIENDTEYGYRKLVMLNEFPELAEWREWEKKNE